LLQTFQDLRAPATAGGSEPLAAAYGAVLDDEESGTALERREGRAVVPGEPGLCPESADLGEQGLPPVGIEMCRDLVDEQDRRRALLALGEQLGVGQHQPEQQRLLLAR